jgi:hypothetical protein
VQKALANQFQQYGIAWMHRRSQFRNSKSTITAYSIAPLICAFHGDPGTAHRQAKEIFLQDDIYRRVFPDIISAEHIFLIKSLNMAIDDYKSYLADRVRSDSSTEADDKQHSLLSYSASKTFLVYIIGCLTEQILNRKVHDLMKWKAKPDLVCSTNTSIAKAWTNVIQAITPSLIHCVEEESAKHKEVQNPFWEVPRSSDLSKKVAVD